MVISVAYSLTQCAHPVPGGTGVAALELLTALKAEADPVEVVTVGALPVRRGGSLELPTPSKRYLLPYPALYELWNNTKMGALDQIVPEADVAHLTVAFCPERRTVPQVCTVHDIFPFTYSEMLTKRGARVLQAGLHRVIERADIIVSPTQATKEELVAQGVDPSRIRVVPLGATAQEFTDEQLQRIRERFCMLDDFVLFAGTVEPRKNLDILLSAMEVVGNEVQLVLVGPTGWGEIADRVPGMRSDRVRVLGKQSRRDLLGLMTAASAVCMPSHAEGFGLPALEAMAQGTPVIHSHCAALTEVVGSTGQRVGADDAAGWGAAMTAFVNETAKSSELGSLARERASGFTWDATAASMRSVYEELV